ncbi:hypothetical protein Cme02nite_55680 [Catellatospora methionotrophica]|uniref:Nuclease SbcCD subunit C n=1 Tax=Catellatospora methionotrophica TaxID=121620 RepID=A0A8J3PGX4_9ACTN|nr:ATP-binding protein [Catellatospora methionotrophica]GIG17236.1 hypothetical protein Cme02nite_55680 [Catellatospora methionotrophica]
MTHDEPLVELLFDRLATDGVPDDVAEVVLGAVGGDGDLRAALDTRPTRLDPAGEVPQQQRAHVYLDSVTICGFRGVGPQRTLPVRPGPGLTLVVGRNGSGKSSFAEAIELALTGDSARWADRNSVWRSGWRNLHQPDTCAITLDLRIDGVTTPTRIRRTWAPGGDLTSASVAVTSAAGSFDNLNALALARPLKLYRPFLTAGDLSRLVTSTPSALHDSINSILGWSCSPTPASGWRPRPGPSTPRSRTSGTGASCCGSRSTRSTMTGPGVPHMRLPRPLPSTT